MVLKSHIIFVLIFGIFVLLTSTSCLAVDDLKNTINTLKALNAKGHKAFGGGEYANAAKYWEKCLNYFANELQNNPNRKKYEEELYLNIGESYRAISNKEKPEEFKHYNKAMHYYKQIDSFVGATKENVNLSICLLNSDKGKRLMDIGLYGKAKNFHKKALSLINNLSKNIQIKDELEAKEQRSLGIIEMNLAHYDSSKEHFHRALELWKKIKAEDEILNEEANVVRLQIEIGQITKAKKELNFLIKAYRDQNSLPVANAYLNLGKCYYLLGNYKDAEACFKKAKKIFEKLSNQAKTDTANLNMGLIAFKQGLYYDAQDYFKLSAGSIDKNIQSMSLSNSAVVSVNLFLETKNVKFLDIAQNSLKKAESLSKAVGDRRMLMRIKGSQGKIFYERACVYENEDRKKDAATFQNKAQKALEESSKLAKELSKWGDLSFYEISKISSYWADLYLKKGDRKSIKLAIMKYNESIQNSKNLYLDHIWYAYYGLAKAYRLNNEIRKAIEYCKVSIDVIENMRNLMGGSSGIGFLRNKHQVYVDLIDMLLDLWETEKREKVKNEYSIEALLYLEKSRLGGLRNIFEQALPDEINHISEKLNEINSRLKKSMNQSIVGELKKQKNELELIIEQEDQLVRKNRIKKATFIEIINNMQPRQVMIEFYYNKKNVYIWKFDKRLKQPYLLYPIKRQLGKKIGIAKDLIDDYLMDVYRYFVSSKSDISNIFDKTKIRRLRNLLSIIYENVFLNSDIALDDYKFITIIPYGKISLLPFSILGIADQKLVDKFVINYYFSSTQQLPIKTKFKGHNLLAIGNPKIPDYLKISSIKKKYNTRGSKPSLSGDKNTDNLIPFKEARDILSRLKIERQRMTQDREQDTLRSWGFEQLDNAGEEVKQIKKRFETHQLKSEKNQKNSTVHANKKISEEFIKKELPKNYNYIHFATHGQLVSKNPLDSFIVFSEGNPGQSQYDSGLLTVKEVRSTLYRKLSGVKLAVLSACQTSVAQSGDESDREIGLEFASLAGAFQSAGVHTVIASLWTVSSKATALLMDKFYYYLLVEEQPIGKALQLAKQYFRDERCKLSFNKIDENGNKENFETSCDKDFFWSPFIILGKID